MAAKDLMTILSEYGVEIRKEGSVLRALCPLHKDTHKPNFTVYPDDKGGSWFCFACSVGGNAAAFVAKMEGIPYSEALQRVNGDMDSLEELKEQIDGLNMQEAQTFNLEANIAISRICRKILHEHPEKTSIVLAFLKSMDEELKAPLTSQEKLLELMKKAHSLEV